jgi:hypothetical protein
MTSGTAAKSIGCVRNLLQRRKGFTSRMAAMPRHGARPTGKTRLAWALKCFLKQSLMVESKRIFHVRDTLSDQEANMKRVLIDAAVAVTALVAPAFSPVIGDDPGYFGRFYPDEKCQSPGPGNPSADGVYYHNDPAQTAEPDGYCDHGRWNRAAGA